MAEVTPALDLVDVAVRYQPGQPPAVSGCTLSVQPGQRLALLGRNGAGKTTLLGVPLGLVPFAGEARVSGIPVSKEHLAEVRRRVGVVFSVPEDQILFPRVIDDILFGLLKRGMGRPEAETRAEGMLEIMGISDLSGLSPHNLSHGQKLRVALAGALVLDPVGQKHLARYLQSLPAAMLIATHNLSFARQACTHFAVLAGGTLPDPPQPIADLPKDPEDWLR